MSVAPPFKPAGVVFDLDGVLVHSEPLWGVAERRVVEELGGDIRVLSEPGDTRFQVRLPARPAGESSS